MNFWGSFSLFFCEILFVKIDKLYFLYIIGIFLYIFYIGWRGNSFVFRKFLILCVLIYIIINIKL